MEKRQGREPMTMHRNAIKTVLKATCALAFGVGTLGARAATIYAGNLLTITSGDLGQSGTGSWFALDANNDGIIQSGEKANISVAGIGAIVIGAAQLASGSHSGPPDGTESPAFDIWEIFGNTGMDYTTVGPTGSTTTGIDLSGWTITWGLSSSPLQLGSGAWQPLNCSSLGCNGHTFTNGNAQFIWDGVYGHAYALNYAATISGATGNAAGLNGVKYFVHLEGCVQDGTPESSPCGSTAVTPLPGAFWLFGSGLIGLIGLTAPRYRSLRQIDGT